MLVAIDFGNGKGTLNQTDALSISARGILNASVLLQFGDTSKLRISSSNGQIDVTTTNATLISRVTKSQTLKRGQSDNTINKDWTGTNAERITHDAGCDKTADGLASRVIHQCGYQQGFHMVPKSDYQRINWSDGEITDTESLRLWVYSSSNQAPAAVAQSITVDENSADNNITLTGDDPDGDALTYTVVTSPSHGSLSGTAPNLTYTPTADYHGADSFTFKVNDGTDDSAVASISITVNEPLIIVENADDLCYEESTYSGMACIDKGSCKGGIGCKTTYPLKNIGDSDLSDVKAFYNENGVDGTMINNCEVSPDGNCSQESNVDMGPIGLLGTTTSFDFTNDITTTQINAGVSTTATVSMSCLNSNNFYATYKKGNSLYRGKVKACTDSTPPDEPGDETVPSNTTEPETPICGAFQDVLQTRDDPSKIEHKSGASATIYNSPDCTLNTGEVDFGQYQSLSCDDGNASATGTYAKSLDINYSNAPTFSTNILPQPSSSLNNETLNANTTLSKFNYNNIATDWHTGLNINFNITNQLKINSLKMTTDNTFNFSSNSLYSLDIGTIGVKSDGVRNSFKTDNNAKNIKISTFNLPANTSVDFTASQTIKMTSMSVGRGSHITLKAPYVEIKTLHQSNSGNGNSVVTIYADYVDMQTLDLDQQATILFKPYTAGKRILFRGNTISASSSSTMIVDSGNYYVKSFDIPGSSDVSSIHASDTKQLINFYIDGDFKPGNNPGINSDGNNGKFGTLPPSNFLFFVNGDVQTGGGGTTFNATVYVEGNANFGSPSFIKGALSSSKTITIGDGSKLYYDQDMDESGWGKCNTYKCANPKPFTEVFSTNNYAKLIIAGNTSLCADNNKDGTCEDPGTSTNNKIWMINNDYDDTNGTAGNNETTLNSSAAYLDIPLGKKVLWAGLTWQGYLAGSNISTKINEAKTIKYKYESDSSYQVDNNAQLHWVYFSDTRMYYQGFVDITSYVNKHQGGYYWIGDIVTTEEKPAGGSFGAWSITVVYEDKSEDFNNITVYSGYQAFAGSGDINNAKSYAEDNECDESNTGVGNQVSSHLTGFLTPKAGSVTSNLVVFAGEGDIGLSGDSGSLTDSDNVEHKLSNAKNPETNIMNATISENGRTVTSGIPYYSPNTLGADIDDFNTSSILSNNQTNTYIKFTTNNDGYMPGLYGLQTKLYTPDICYDYTYGQNGTYFTAPNETNASIDGTFSTSTPINIKLYFRNKENSDVTIQNLKVDIDPIDIKKAKYHQNSVYVMPPGSLRTSVTPDSSADSYIHGIEIGNGDFGSLDYFYTYYSLDATLSNISDMLINAILHYSLTITVDNTELDLGAQMSSIQSMEMCKNDSSYEPEPGMFNVVQAGETKSTDPYYYFNIPTQVVNRVGNFLLESMDPDDLNKSKAVTQETNVSISMVNMAGFHYTNATCTDPDTSIAIGAPVTAHFNTNDNNITINKNAMRTAAMFSKASQNAAFRLIYKDEDNDTKATCSRDNFSIRPESFQVDIFDKNQTGSNTQFITNNIGSAPSLNLATGYDYVLKINATDHFNHFITNSYTTALTDMSLTWKTPNNNCNDTNNTLSQIDFNSGIANVKLTHNQVGEYTLNINDSTWTSVDSNPAIMSHHKGVNFRPVTTLDCDNSSTNKDIVQDENSTLYNGCQIDSNHTNNEYSSVYNDIDITYHPYKLDLSNLKASHGVDLNTNFPKTGKSAWIYMSDIAQENNMSLNFIGKVAASGYNNIVNSNFVDGCYAQPLTISLNSSAVNTQADYKYHFSSSTKNGTTIYNSWDTNNSSQEMLNLTTKNFPKENNGTMSMKLHYNYDHNSTKAINPQKINLFDLNVSCTNHNNCKMRANFISNFENNQTVDINAPLVHYYGRTHAPRQKFTTPIGTKATPAKAFIYYEIYCNGATCDKTLLPDGPTSKTSDDPRWFINTQHTVSLGSALNVSQRNASAVTTKTNPSGNAPDFAEIYYDSSNINFAGYPYKTTMENNASSWLIYNQYNPTAKTNEFQVEFLNGAANWSGAHETNTTTVNGGTSITNRRLMW